MKITKGLIEKLLSLSKGEAVPASGLKGDWIDQMREDGVLTIVTHGSRRSYRCSDKQLFLNYLEEKHGFKDLGATLELISGDEQSRSTQVELTGNSKFVQQRAMRGFLVNSYSPIPATLDGAAITIAPLEGLFAFIYDYFQFRISSDVLVVGMENSENFREIREQKWLFDKMFPEKKILFVSRYPQNRSHDLINWLQMIDNEYVHFGDLDLAGVRIFLTEFWEHLGNRSSFLIPPDYEERISRGSRERYDAQLPGARNLSASHDPTLQALIDCIHKYHRGYDQEGYCKGQ